MCDIFDGVFFQGCGAEWREVPVRDPLIIIASTYSDDEVTWPMTLKDFLFDLIDGPDELALRLCFDFDWDTPGDRLITKQDCIEAAARIGIRQVERVARQVHEDWRGSPRSNLKATYAYEMECLECLRLDLLDYLEELESC